MGFKEIALPLIVKGVPCAPVRPNSKAAFLPLLPDKSYQCTLDQAKVMEWDAAFPNHNGAAVATGAADGVWFLELDSPDVAQRIKTETGQEIPITFRVRSRPGRGHLYWKNTPASLAMGNLSQTYVKGADWSARVFNQYVVAPGSIHPHSQQPYVALDNAEIVPAPDWLVAWCVSQKISKELEKVAKVEPERDAFGLIPHGSIHGYMLREAGKLRAMGLGADEIYPALSALVHKNCAPPINEEKIKTMAQSICNFAEGRPVVGLQMSNATALPPVDEEEEDVVSELVPYPKFPTWVMARTSIYENLVEPFCKVNSRIDYFMWVPATIMLLNYVSPKIKIKGVVGDRDFKGNIYTVMIGDAEKAMKSSSINDAKEYFTYIGCQVSAGRELKSAEGRTITTSVGSMESLGLTMQRTNAKSAILIYDELKTLVSKASIESSSMTGYLLTCYEGNTFENGVKATKDSFSIAPPHCISLIACNPVDTFTEHWSKLSSSASGMDSRFTLTLQPEIMPEPRIYQGVNFYQNSSKTKALIDKALNQGVFEYEDTLDPKLQALVQRSNRLAARAEKWALALAIDLGLSEIDAECIDRAVAIVKYEEEVKAYMATYEAKTKEAQIQQEILRILRKNRGTIGRRELRRKLDADSYGTTLWNMSYGGLMKNFRIHETGTGKKGDPLMVVLGRKKTDENS